jgi:hypothetical protein
MMAENSAIGYKVKKQYSLRKKTGRWDTASRRIYESVSSFTLFKENDAMEQREMKTCTGVRKINTCFNKVLVNLFLGFYQYFEMGNEPF